MAHELSPPEQWLNLYGDILYRYGFARVRDAAVAEDLVQETLLAALKARARYTGKASEQTWMIGILKHKMVDYFRKAGRENTREFDDRLTGDENNDFFDSQGHWQGDVSSWCSPDNLLQQEQFFDALQACIERLPPRLAQLFIMRELDGMGNDEICRLLSIATLNNFWVMMSRARLQLRHCLDLNWFNR